MKASELRLGNYLIVPGIDRIVQVRLVCLSHFSCVDKDGIVLGESVRINYQPIPLTEELLLKFGFEDDRDNLMILRKGVFEFYFDKVDKDGISLYEKWDGNFLCNVEYVHEFQNLYFALTGEELVVKE
jgi:hypothetical protein